jgi:hypothetical protein
MGSILNQILGSIQRFPKCLKGVRIIAFAFFLDGRVPEAAYRGAEAFDRLVSNPEGFRQRVFQGFLPKSERRVPIRLEGVPGTQSAPLTLPIRPEGLNCLGSDRHENSFIRTHPREFDLFSGIVLQKRLRNRSVP